MTKILVSLPHEFLTEIDRAARREHVSRSAFVREAVRRYLHVAEPRELPRRLDPAIQRAIMVQDNLGKYFTGRWESAAEIRRWRDSRRRS